jgi:Ca2+-transporting ATPase
VSISFLTLAFGQLWHVFNMRGRGSPVIRNAVNRNPYVWLAVAFCAAIILLGVYLPTVAYTLQVIAPDRAGWILVIIASLTPLLVGITMGALSSAARVGRG